MSPPGGVIVESEQQRVIYWPGVVLVALIALCAMFTIALAALMLTDVRVQTPSNAADPGQWGCGTVRDMTFRADPVYDWQLPGEGLTIDHAALAACREQFGRFVPFVVGAGIGSLSLFVTSVIMFRVQRNSRGSGEISHRPEPHYAS